MSDMFGIARELSIPKIGFNIMLSSTVKKLDAFKFDGVAESDNTAAHFTLFQRGHSQNKTPGLGIAVPVLVMKLKQGSGYFGNFSTKTCSATSMECSRRYLLNDVAENLGLA